MLELVERPVLNCEGSDSGVPWLARASLFESKSQVKKKAVKIRDLNSALCAVFRGIFDIVQIREDFSRELENRDNAGRNTERIHVGRRLTQMEDANEGEEGGEDGGIVYAEDRKAEQLCCAAAARLNSCIVLRHTLSIKLYNRVFPALTSILCRKGTTGR